MNNTYEFKEGRIIIHFPKEESKAWYDKYGVLHAIPTNKNTPLRDEQGELRSEWQ